MAVQLNHTILWARDSKSSAAFLAEMLGLPAPAHWGPFEVVTTANGANLDYLDRDGEIASQHYAFLVSEAEFDAIFGRIKGRRLPYWADPGQTQTRRDQPSRRRARTLFRGPERPPARDHHAALRQRRLESVSADCAARRRHSALTISSVIFLASPSSIMVLSR